MGLVTSFEVISQPIVPGVPDLPYVQQGSFLQLTNVGTAPAQVTVGYTATPAFVVSSGAVILAANFIDNTGNVTMFPASSFILNPVGFTAVTIPPNGTFIFGVQYLLNPGAAAEGLEIERVGSTPQSGVGTRGIVTLTGTPGARFAALATIRQVFNNYDSGGNLMDVSEAAYSVPIVGGPIVTL